MRKRSRLATHWDLFGPVSAEFTFRWASGLRSLNHSVVDYFRCVLVFVSLWPQSHHRQQRLTGFAAREKLGSLAAFHFLFAKNSSTFWVYWPLAICIWYVCVCLWEIKSKSRQAAAESWTLSPPRLGRWTFEQVRALSLSFRHSRCI